MATEIELKLALPRSAAPHLGRHRLLAPLPAVSHTLQNTYYDTPDFALQRRGVALRLRRRGKTWLLTVKSTEPAVGGLAARSEWETVAQPGVWDFGHVDDPKLRQDLEGITPRLTALFTTHFRRRAWTLSYGRSRVEVALDLGTIASGERSEALAEVELELLAGERCDLFALARELQATLPLCPASASKAERGYRLFLGEPKQPCKAKIPPLSRDLTPIAAFQHIASACLDQLQRNLGGLAPQCDPEYLHQARIALRRLRSALKIFAPTLPQGFAAPWSAAFRPLAAALGDARDWDVFFGETLPPIVAAFPQDHGAGHLPAAAGRCATRAANALRRQLAGPDHPRLLLDFTAALASLPSASADLEAFARAALNRQSRQTRRLARRHAVLSDAERHRLRIRIKKLRYTLECFATLLPRRRLKPYLAALAQLQDELGLANDHVTALELLHRLPARHRSGPVLGWLHGRHALLLAEQAEALETWLAQSKPWKRK